MDSDQGRTGGVADERDPAVVADADGGVVPDRAGVASEERATADMSGHGVSSGLRLGGQVLGSVDVIVRKNGGTHRCECQSLPRKMEVDFCRSALARTTKTRCWIAFRVNARSGTFSVVAADRTPLTEQMYGGPSSEVTASRTNGSIT